MLTLCTVLLKGSRCSRNLFFHFQPTFNLIDRSSDLVAIYMEKKKKKNLHTLPESLVFVYLAFYFLCLYTRTLPIVLFEILLRLLFSFPPFVTLFTSRVHCPGKIYYRGLIAVLPFSPFCPTSHTVLQ